MERDVSLAVIPGRPTLLDLLDPRYGHAADDGPCIAERLRRQWLHLQVLLTSGSAEGSILPTFLAEPGTGFIQKPFLPNELARKLRRIARPRQVTIRHIVREAGPVSRRISRAGSRGSFQWM